MSGFNYAAGRSNNMMAAESRGMVTIGRWARQYGVSAAAAVEVMRPGEAHHTGTGRVGKSRLTPVIDGDREATPEEISVMKELDRAAKAARAAPPREVPGCTARWLSWPGRYARRRFPEEQIEYGLVALLFADGRIECRHDDGRATRRWERLSGLVIACGGEIVVADNVNRQYDDPAEIARRICQQAVTA
jgi:hypothetical protein